MSIPLPALLLIVACGLGWAGFDLMRKMLVREIPPVALVFLLTLGSVPLFGAWMVEQRAGGPGAGYWLPALVSVSLNVVAYLLFLGSMRIAPLSMTIPLLSLTPVFATLISVPLLGERPSPSQAAGILLVVAGALGLHGWRRSSGPPGAAKGALMMALTALLWSLTISCDKLGVERSSEPFHGFVLSAGVAAGVLLVLVIQGRSGDLARVRQVPGLFVFALAISTLALGFQLVALPRVPVSTVETLKRGIGSFMALLSGGFVFHEPVTVRKVAAVGVMVVGVGLLLTDFGF
jgi:drug/metabolite transporter (DMT)-like permease